jgi:hypothetical protein
LWLISQGDSKASELTPSMGNRSMLIRLNRP